MPLAPMGANTHVYTFIHTYTFRQIISKHTKHLTNPVPISKAYDCTGA